MTDSDFRKRARVILRNMAAERPGVLNAILGRRWVIADEPLRGDAQRLLMEEARTDPDVIVHPETGTKLLRPYGRQPRGYG